MSDTSGFKPSRRTILQASLIKTSHYGVIVPLRLPTSLLTVVSPMDTTIICQEVTAPTIPSLGTVGELASSLHYMPGRVRPSIS